MYFILSLAVSLKVTTGIFTSLPRNSLSDLLNYCDPLDMRQSGIFTSLPRNSLSDLL
jgi:hypothetical protein